MHCVSLCLGEPLVHKPKNLVQPIVCRFFVSIETLNSVSQCCIIKR